MRRTVSRERNYVITDTLNAADLRRWAMQCLAQANDPMSSGEERARLLTMRTSLLALADNADWLAGCRDKTPLPRAG
jgi:hypothetical protein